MQALSFAVHIPLVCFGIAFPAMVLFAEWLYLRTGDDLYRTCIAGRDPRHAWCVFVNTDQSPPGVTRDPDQRPNAAVARSGR